MTKFRIVPNKPNGFLLQRRGPWYWPFWETEERTTFAHPYRSPQYCTQEEAMGDALHKISREQRQAEHMATPIKYIEGDAE